MRALILITLLLFSACTANTVGLQNADTAMPEEAAGVLPTDCPTSTEQFTVRGNSMEGILGAGENVTVVLGYYGCHAVERGDLIAYNRSPELLIKRVVGIPGDAFSLKQANSSWQIMINGAAATTSEGVAYALSEQSKRMLALYAQSYPVLPNNTFLILGNRAAGSDDSTRFGLVDTSGIIGRAVPEAS